VARGWESKSVEDQISERQSESKSANLKKPNRRELEQKSRREGILLVRTRTFTALQSAHDERYKALLQRTLDHLDSQLREFEGK
jgi:hypothetical protein